MSINYSSDNLEKSRVKMQTRSQAKDEKRNEEQLHDGMSDKYVSPQINYDIDLNDNEDLKSCISSPSTCVSNSLEAKLKLARAHLLKQKLKEKLELEQSLQLLEAQKEIELAELECAIFEEPTIDKPLKIKIKGDCNSPENREVHRGVVQSTDRFDLLDLKESLATVIGHASLPKVEMTAFNGQSNNYLIFTRQFDNIITSKVHDKGQLLSYLIYYCTGKARKAIEACVTLPSEEGYDRARAILHDLYGQEHMIARAHINELVSNTAAIPNTSDSLSDFATTLRNSHIALTQMGYTADLNSAANLEKIVLRLPLEFQSRWADLADHILVSGREPDFNDLTKFVETRARAARTRYGQLVLQGKQSIDNRGTYLTPKPSGSYSDRPNMNYMNNQPLTKSYRSCNLCGGDHRIPDCSVFQKEPLIQRRSIARSNNLCYLCLGQGHSAKYCRSNLKCTVPGCLRRHHTLLHSDSQREVEVRHANTNLARKQTCEKVFFGTIPVRVSGPNGMVETYAFLDSGSDTSLVSDSLIRELGLKGKEAVLNLTTINGQSRQPCLDVELEVFAYDGTGSINLTNAYSMPSIPLIRETPAEDWILDTWDHLSDIPIINLTHNRIDILIGSDATEAFWALEQRTGGRKQPFATRTHLGWVLFGRVGSPHPNQRIMWCGCSTEGQTQEDLDRLFNHEFQDLESHEKGMSVEDQQAVHTAKTTCRFVDSHLEVRPPWKLNSKVLENNSPVALGRLRCLKNRFIREPDLFERYKQRIEDHIRKGHIIRSATDLNITAANRWFIPHHPVVNPKKPEKLRIVFDCAAKHQGMSLNDRLLQGPNTVNSLVGVLLRFRKHKTAIAADIEEMFLQVKLPPEDQHAFSLLWWEDHDLRKQPVCFQLTVHPFGAISSPFCANFALQQVIEQFKPVQSVLLEDVVDRCFYVDDCLTSFETASDAKSFITELTETLKQGGFKLAKWVSNDREVLKSIGSEERAPALRELNFELPHVERTLGLQWDTWKDVFRYNGIVPDKPPTRRGVLSTIASIFDPLGLVAPFVLPAKQLLQSLHATLKGWDDILRQPELNIWNAWKETIKQLGDIEFNRCFQGSINSSIVNTQLHVFSDASEKGYGTVAYIRYVDSTGSISCCLVMAKARVTPRKVQTIPRLELTAATLAARTCQMITTELRVHFDKITFWCDSAIVLHYIHNTEARYHTFVANRVANIHRLTCNDNWKYVPSELNIADWTSRGLSKIDHRLKLWLSGPYFLWDPEYVWPHWNNPIPIRDTDIEVKATVLATVGTELVGLQRLVNYYSDWIRLLKAVAWFSRFKSYLLIKTKARTDITLNLGRVKVTEMQEAETVVIRYTQAIEFYEELATLNKHTGSSVPPKLLNRFKGLNPIVVDGILLVGGRLHNANPAITMRHPIILPGKGHVIDVLLRHHHYTQGHIGASQLLGKIREKYWILRGGVAVKRIVHHCAICRRITPRLASQVMAPLPHARIEVGNHPFAFVGTDFFGPFLVRRGRSTEKRYGCIFTCMKVRAIHIEITHNMTSDSFLMALMRFSCRRGYPTEIFCDNGSNFVGAYNELNNEITQWDQDAIHDRLLRHGITWHFNPPAASHRGGVWERMIRSIRRILNAIMSERVTSDECLATSMAEVERIINDRPLTPVTSDPNDLEVLSPSKLLLLRSNTGMLGTIAPGDPIVKQWRQANHIAEVFWKRWVKEYLPLLQPRQKWHVPTRNFEEGDIVIVTSEVNIRGKWPLGRITKVLLSSDGHVRTVEVKMATSTVLRDIRSLSLLETVAS